MDQPDAQGQTPRPDPDPSPASASVEPITQSYPAPPPIAPPSAPVPGAPLPVPPAAAVPPVAWAEPTAAPRAKGGRTTLAAAAGIAMLVLGVIGALIGIGVIVFGGVVGNLDLSQFQGTADLGPNAASLVGGVVVFGGIIVLVYSVFYIVGGIAVLQSRDWGRVIGIVVGIISGLIWLTGLSGDRGGVVFSLILLLIHLYIVVVLVARWREVTPAAA